MTPVAGTIHISFFKKFYFTVLLNLLRVIRFVVPKKNAPYGKDVVVIEPYGMGDIISLQPLLRELKRDGWSITIIAQKRWEPVLNDPSFMWITTKGSWSDFGKISLIKEILSLALKHRHRFSVGIDPRGDVRSLIVLHLLGCAKILTLDHYLGTDVLIPKDLATAQVKDDHQVKSRWEMAAGFCKLLQIDIAQLIPPDLSTLLPSIKRHNARDRVGLVPVAPWSGKLWPNSHWSDLCKMLTASGFTLVGLCGPNQKKLVLDSIGCEKMPVLEASDVTEYAVNLSTCEIVISVDSGPMHLASALNIPVVALFGTGQIPLWQPFSDHSCVVSPENHPPQAVHQIDGNTSIGHALMAAISPQAVFKAFSTVPNSRTNKI